MRAWVQAWGAPLCECCVHGSLQAQAIASPPPKPTSPPAHQPAPCSRRWQNQELYGVRSTYIGTYLWSLPDEPITGVDPAECTSNHSFRTTFPWHTCASLTLPKLTNHHRHLKKRKKKKNCNAAPGSYLIFFPS
jgi:hypothetical protein